MNVLFASEKTEFKLSLAKQLIPLGINLIHVNNLDEVYYTLLVNEKDFIAFIDDEQYDIKVVLKTIIGLKKEKKGAKIILLTSTSEMQLIRIFLQLGADLVLQNNLTDETILKKSFDFIKQNSPSKMNRFLRINLQKTKNCNVELLADHQRLFLNGQITDLSMGGIVARFNDSDLILISKDRQFPNSRLTLENKMIKADLKLFKVGDEQAVFGFNKIRFAFQNTLSEYIYRKSQNLLDL